MRPTLKVLDNVLERIRRVKDPCTGGLYGIIYERTLLVVGMSFSEPNDVESYMEMQLKCPTGLDFCGFVSFLDNYNGKNPECFKEHLKEVLVTDNPVVLVKSTSSEEICSYIFRNARLVQQQFTSMSREEFAEIFVTLRLHTSLFLASKACPKRISRAIENLQKMVSYGGTIFHFHRTDVYVYGSDLSDFYEDRNIRLGNIYDSTALFKDCRLDKGVLEVEMYLQTSDVLFEDPETYAPYVFSRINDSKKLVMMLPIDALCIAERSRLAKESYGLLVDGVCRSISLLHYNVLKYLEKPERICELQQYHFFPKLLGHSLTVVYPQDLDDDELRNYRQNLHEQLNLPMDYPIFRKGNGLVLLMDSELLCPLLNVHNDLKASGVIGGTVCIVDGLYGYYHYMQDNFDDNGWGCAYRSLQTLFSWFRFQGYTTERIPSHKDIQQCLIDIKDKKENFLGSRQWIGSTEVSFCLDAMIGITSRILSVTSGAMVHTKGEELLHHFEIQKTPVMIGGGFLAHTILGVHYNQDSGDIKFLVLDPHYVGPDNISIIQKKGWVGWKGKEFWNKQHFYNMCLPQRPQNI